jgi:putative DNA primase/helicase
VSNEKYERRKVLERYPHLVEKLGLHKQEVRPNGGSMAASRETAPIAQGDAAEITLPDSSEIPEPPPHVDSSQSAPPAEPWPAPEPLGGELPIVQAFDLKLLPEALRPLVEDTAERMQVPLDFPAVAAVLSLAAVTGGRALMLPKDQDPTWVVVPNLWGGIVALPGFMKTPAIDAVTCPLDKIEERWRREYEETKKQYERDKELADLRASAWKEQCKTAFKKGDTAPLRPDDPPAEPVLRRLMTHDATHEKLHVILDQNPGGVLVKRDELSGWFAGLDKPGREGERAFFLLAHNGQSGFIVDRMGRGTVWVPHCTVSMLGAITPARLRSYLTDALRDGPSNDGLLQRFQLLVFPDQIGSWKWVNRAPNSDAITEAEAIYQRLVALDVERPLRLYFDNDAQQLFIKWLTELENKLRNHATHPALVSHLAKYRKLLPALALLFELADNQSQTEVSLDHTAQAADFCDYAESHARRIYAMIISPERAAAAELGRHIKEGWKFDSGSFTLRDVYWNDWTGLDTPEKVRAALSILIDAGWVRQITPPPKGVGRPSENYRINPRVQGRKP